MEVLVTFLEGDPDQPLISGCLYHKENQVPYEFVIPVGTLEALPAEKKIKVAVVMGGVTTYTYWWRIDGLLGDAEGNGIDGWFAEPDTALSRHSPYEWEGFDFIEESVSNVDHLASYLNELNQLDEVEKETFVPKASASTNGPVKERLYSIVDTDKNDRLTLAEIRAALAKPWFAQPISQLVTKYESEWFYKAEKWDALDELMGHTAEQPNAGWVAEKKRIEHLSWWKVVAETEALSAEENIWHMHLLPYIGFMSGVSRFSCAKCGKNIALTSAIMKKIAAPSVLEQFAKEFAETANVIFSEYGINTCSQVSFILGQGKVETQGFTRFRESLNYSRATFTPRKLYNLVTTAVNNGFARKGLNLTEEQKLKYIDDHLLGNDAGYGQHSFGSLDYPNNDYRGRGLLHLTFYEAYKKCADAIGVRVDSNPELAETDIKVILASGSWYWKANNIGMVADDTSLDMDLKIRRVTAKINTGLDQLTNRVVFTKEIAKLMNDEFGGCAG
ncbi:hypothetical protein HX797_16915 [Pseudomonas edaphica]|uniref:EF-hand domain-containing protein n=2 Tax=Pseudomonas edaphica TaxID=2006980 RepID=A0A7Y7V7U8_9PSED|nr:hypothetical protein [Pseudomonas edaphica]